ncbi:MAG: dihydrofolate reductase [Patescibacteria group bacterium]|nr:MAG: dihydrofolate reductase [Patescibacteria group bacterium]
MIISIIAAVAEKNYVIGANNKLIWHIPADLKRFKSLTYGHHIIMGRKTYESLGKPLPGRTNIVLTRDKHYSVEGGLVFNSLESALDYCRDENESEVFIIGGAEIYKQSLNLADRLYITWVKGDYKGDSYFPNFDLNNWSLVSNEDFDSYRFSIYEKKIKS